MVASSRLLLAFTALAVGSLARIPDARAQGPARATASAQPLEIWSRTMSGLATLELGCQPASRPWQLRETVDPWASAQAPCEPPAQRAPAEFVATIEIVDPWPTRSNTLRITTHEIIDPWSTSRR